MSCFVFLGPTLDRDEARATLDAVILPPAAQGDVLRAANERPFAIGIVDGYFERLPAVWHKEILWAISQGIHVFGAGSMGALRAAELERFGMRGVGKIFGDFASGVLDDDDEVAVVHGEETDGYRATSEAMVNIRATFRAAESAGVIAGDVRLALEALAKGLFYPDRSYPLVFARAVEQGTLVAADALRAFVREYRVDQKRADARAMLRAMRECCEAGVPPEPPSFSFAHTEAWDDVVQWAEAQPSLGASTEVISSDLLAAEVRLLGDAGRRYVAAALARAAAGALARRARILDRPRRADALDSRVRQALGAGPHGEPADERLERWRAERGLSGLGYAAFLDRGAELGWLQEHYRYDLERHVADELCLGDDYARLATRARRKQAILAELGLEEPTLADAGIDQPTLFVWYFETVLRRAAPVDLDAHLAEAGLPDRPALEREALREWLFRKRDASTPES